MIHFSTRPKFALTGVLCLNSKLMRRSPHALAAVLFLSSLNAHAAEESSTVLESAVSLMVNQRWELAYEAFSEINEQQLEAAGVIGSFGKLLFSMGICQMELAKSTDEPTSTEHYRAALKVFARCHTWKAEEGEPNLYRQRSLLRMGMCQQALGYFDQAEANYERFQLEKNQVYDRYDHGNLLLNQAQCAAMKKAPDDAKASEFLSLAFNERERHELTKLAVLDTALVVYDASYDRISAEDRRRYQQWMTELFPIKHQEVTEITQRVSRSVAIALKNEDEARALSVLNILPWIKQWQMAMDGEAELPSKSEIHRESGVIESFESLAHVYGESSNEAYDVYDFLLVTFPESDSVQNWSYQKILFDFKSGDGEKAAQQVSVFKEKFPESKYATEIQLLELGYLFDVGSYDQVLRQAKRGMEQVTADDGFRETCLYLMAGASSFLGDYLGSIELAKKYQNDFPAGKFQQQVVYFEGVSYARLGYQTEAREYLKSAASIDGPMSGYAGFELAVLDFDFVLYESSLEKLKKLLAGELDDELAVQVNLLAARTTAILRDRSTAEMHYLEALKLAQGNKFQVLEQEVLYYIVSFYGREEIAGEPNLQMAQSLPYYDTFFEKFGESVYSNQVAAAAMPALKSVGQSNRGIETLTSTLKQSCKVMREPGMQEAASALVWARIEQGEKVANMLAEIDGDDIYAQVRRFALAEVYAAGVDQAGSSWGRKLKYDALERAMYAEISANQPELSLPVYIQLVLGDWFLVEGFFPELALEQFDVSADLTSQQNRATLGRAKSLRLIGGNENLDKARSLLEPLVERSENDPDFHEKVRFELIEVHAESGDWDILTESSRGYLIDDKIVYQRARVSYLLALSYDKRGLVEDAIANYSRVFASFTRLLAVSAPAVDRLCLLTWQRNSPVTTNEAGDRQVAYQLAHRYLTLIEDYPNWEKSRLSVEPYLLNLEANVETWEASGEVVSVEQMLKEMRQGKR